MRIGLFTDTYLPDINGVVSSIETLRVALVASGHEVYVICPKSSFEPSRMDENILRIPGIQLKFLYGYTLSSPWQSRAFELVKELNLDLIHVHTEFGIGLFARKCAKKLNIPIVATYHTLYEDYTHYVNITGSKTIENWVKEAAKDLSRYFASNVDEVIAPTEKAKERLEKYGVTNKINIVPTGLDLSKFKQKAPIIPRPFAEETFMLTFVGRLAEEKSIDLIIRQIAEMNKQRINVALQIVGDGPERNNLTELVNQLNINDKVHFEGKVAHDNIAGYYQNTDAFISASMSETQGMTFLEALACGTIILACDEVALSNVLFDGENGYFFHGEQELAEKIQLLINRTDEEKESMRQKAIEVADFYSLENFAREAEDVYMDTIELGNTYKIVRVTLKDNIVKVFVQDKESETCFNIFAEEFFSTNMKEGQEITAYQYKTLNSMHGYTYSYLKCLKKLNYKDQSVQEIKNLLDNQKNIDSVQKDRIINELTTLGYLNDQALVDNQFEYDQMKLLGKKKTAYALEKRGVDKELIKEKLETIPFEDEVNRALEKGNLLLRNVSHRSYRETLQNVRVKLANNGFDSATINEAMANLEYEKDIENEISNLKEAYKKAHDLYKRKFEGFQLKQKITLYLMNKGYSKADILQVMEEINENQ